MQYRSTDHDDGITEVLVWLRVVSMFWSLLFPLAHLPLDHPRVDPISSRVDHFLADLRQQIRPPPPLTADPAWALRYAATQNLQGARERDPKRSDRFLLGGLEHQHPDHKMVDQQRIEFLNDSGRRLAPQTQ